MQKLTIENKDIDLNLPLLGATLSVVPSALSTKASVTTPISNGAVQSEIFSS